MLLHHGYDVSEIRYMFLLVCRRLSRSGYHYGMSRLVSRPEHDWHLNVVSDEDGPSRNLAITIPDSTFQLSLWHVHERLGSAAC